MSKKEQSMPFDKAIEIAKKEAIEKAIKSPLTPPRVKESLRRLN